MENYNVRESQRVKRQKKMEVVKVIRQVLPLIQEKEKFFKSFLPYFMCIFSICMSEYHIRS